MTAAPIAPSYTQGYVLCSPSKQIIGHTYSRTKAEATSLMGSDWYWEIMEKEGWTVIFVYARIFVPVFHVSAKTSEVAE